MAVTGSQRFSPAVDSGIQRRTHRQKYQRDAQAVRPGQCLGCATTCTLQVSAQAPQLVSSANSKT